MNAMRLREAFVVFQLARSSGHASRRVCEAMAAGLRRAHQFRRARAVERVALSSGTWPQSEAGHLS
ncbi:MAG: hypothetical protein QM736_25260 [Vicinamibacterales bacterium]